MICIIIHLLHNGEEDVKIYQPKDITLWFFSFLDDYIFISFKHLSNKLFILLKQSQNTIMQLKLSDSTVNISRPESYNFNR